MIQRILPAYYFSMECVYLYFLLFLFYTRIGEIPSIFSFIVVGIVANLVLLFSLKQKQVSGAIPFLGGIVCGGIAYLLEFTTMSAVLCTVFLYFRIGAFIKDSSLWKEERTNLAILFYCSSFVIFIEGWIFKYPYMNWLFGIVILFTILISIGIYLQHAAGNNASKNVTPIVGVLGIAVVLTGLVTLLIPPIKWIILNVFEGLFLIVGFLLMPLFNLVEGIVLTSGKQYVDDNEFLQVGLTGKKEEVGNQNLFVNLPMWAWLVLLALLILVIWYFVRKRKMNTDIQDQSMIPIIQHSPSSPGMSRKGKFFREPAPNEHIRKLIFKLQIYANKYGFGRYEHETVQEWFKRVGFQENEDLFLAYESVRYGTVVINNDDTKNYEKVIDGLKKEMKERRKKAKEKGEEA